jgi:redox-sensing transcriptional repressor
MKALGSNPRAHEFPEASLRRLPIYYRYLQDLMAAGTTPAVSCADLARALGLDPTLVRKDIEMTGIVGKPRVGYPLGGLVAWIENFLGLSRPKAAVLAGTGSLGSALLGYQKFRSHGMEIVAAFDVDADKIGQRIHGTEVQPLFCLPDFVRNNSVPLGLIATPAGAAQSVADLLVSGGIRAIWNFAPAHIRVPEQVILQNEDLYHSLASLSFKLEHRLNSTPLETEIYVQNN